MRFLCIEVWEAGSIVKHGGYVCWSKQKFFSRTSEDLYGPLKQVVMGLKLIGAGNLFNSKLQRIFSFEVILV
jgi:hypothetical protein